MKALSNALALVGAVLAVFASGHAASATPLFTNPGFETPAGSSGNVADTNAGGWKTTHPAGVVCGGSTACRPIEYWTTSGTVPSGQGAQFIELTASDRSMVFQPVALSTGDVLTWSFLHRGRYSATSADVAQFLIGIPIGLPTNSLPADSYGDVIVQVATTSNGTITPPTGNGTINAPAPAGNGWVRYSGSYTYTGPPGTRNVGFYSVSGALNIPGGGNFIDGVDVDRVPHVAVANVNPCCPPWTPSALADMMVYQGSGGIAAPYTLVFANPAAAPGVYGALQAYIEYLNAVNSAMTNLNIAFTLYDQGIPPVPPGNGTPVGSNYFETWTANGPTNPNTRPVPYPPAFFPGFPMQVGHQYLVHTGIYLDSGQHFFPADCANIDIYVRIIAPGPSLAPGGPSGSARVPILQITNKQGTILRRVEVRSTAPSRQ
jgi:hypothetical protein